MSSFARANVFWRTNRFLHVAGHFRGFHAKE